MTVTTHRTIIESAQFKRERDAILPNIARWDEVMRGVTWALCREPGKAGRVTGVDGVFALPTEPWPGAPGVVIYYTFNEDTVTLHSVILAEPSS